jgi:hypothetical protein
MPAATPHDTEAPRRPRWAPLGWLILGTVFALVPAVWLETNDRAHCLLDPECGVVDLLRLGGGAWGPSQAFFRRVSQAPLPTTDAGRALVFESELRMTADRVSRDAATDHVLVLGNSVVAWNVDHAQIKDCCGPATGVAKVAATRLTMVETAMLGPVIVEMSPAMVVLSMNRWDAAATAQWEALRFYDPEVAWRLSEPGEVFNHLSTHLTGLAIHRFLAFRHRQALLQLFGRSFGTPLDEMLDLTGGAPWIEREVQALNLPTLESRALRDLAQQLSKAGIRLLLFSAPTRELVRDPGSDKKPALRPREFQPELDLHLSEIAREEDFVYAPPSAFVGFSADMFSDGIHMRPAGVQRFTTQLSALTGAILVADAVR